MPDNVKILFLGDIVGRPGRKILSRFLPQLKASYKIDVTIANCENAAGGLGLTEKVGLELLNRVDAVSYTHLTLPTKA